MYSGCYVSRGIYNDKEVIIAAFLHDIGHLIGSENNNNTMSNYGIDNHEKIGSKYVCDNGLSIKVGKLIESHVSAKRYLVSRYDDYYNKLSNASTKNIRFSRWKNE